MTAALLLAVVTATVAPGQTARCRAWVGERGGSRQEVACAPINDPAVFNVPAFLLPEPGIGQVVTYCVEAVSTSGAVSECVPASQIIAAPAPPRGPFMPVPQ